tara:strand:- start:340 stop:672 length:333 start_codon:yes stop_codon:yes gene_type:complete
MGWKRTREMLGTRRNLINKAKYSFFVMIFDYVNMALDLKKEQYGLRWRLHSTLLRYESKTKYRKVLNKLFEEALEYAAIHRDEFDDPMDRQLIDFLKSYIYHKKSQPTEL